MRTLRAALSRGTIVAAIAWSLVILFTESFKGTNVGGKACYTDPTCGEVGWIPTATWIGGILVILVIGYALHERARTDSSDGPPAATLADKLVAVVAVVTVLLIAAAVFTLYLDHRPIADLWLGMSRS
jgi:hypothetical protein